MFKVTGLDDVLAKLTDLPQNAEEAAERRLEEVAKLILQRAQQLTPVDTGRLKRSGYTDKQQDKVIIGFRAPYALYVHERTDIHHTNGQAKFLETAVKELAPAIQLAFGPDFLAEVAGQGTFGSALGDVPVTFGE